MKSRPRPARLIALVLGLAVLGSACGATKPERSTIGVRRVALDFAFSDKDLKVPIPPNVIVQYLPALSDDIAAAFPDARPFLPVNAAPSPFACPKAADNAEVSDVAPSAITTPPKAGTYFLRNEGSFTIQTATLPITVPYPPFSKLVIRDVKVEDVTDVYAGSARKTSFIVEEELVPGFVERSTLQYDNGELSLVQRETINNSASTFFTPTPAVEVFRFTGPGGSWQAAGIDTATTNALVVQGSIGAREAIDVCGLLVDTLPTSTDEREVSLADQETGGTEAGKPTITNYAPQYGGLPIRRERHTKRVVNSEIGPLTIATNAVSTLMSIRPAPLEEKK